MKHIPGDYVKDICKIGQGELCCSYLLMGPDGYECAKWDKNIGFRRAIEIRRANGTIKSLGDNCNGYTDKT